jgi:hypothetical protein
MKKLFEYSRIAVLLLGLLVGVQIPGFVEDYRNLLEARVMESSLSVSEFQDDADRFFDGDLNRLIAYYQSRQDLIIISGGESIEAIFARNRYLADALVQFNQSLSSAYYQVFVTPVPEVREQIRESYQYSVRLNAPAVISGISLALLAMILFELICFILKISSLGVLRLFKPKKRIRNPFL